MSPGQMWPGQMSTWQLTSVKEGSRNVPLKFGQNRVSNSWDIINMNKCRQDKCCLYKCYHDSWHLNANAIARRTVRFPHLSFVAQLLPCCSVCAVLLSCAVLLVCAVLCFPHLSFVAQLLPCCSFVPFCSVCAIFVHKRHWATNCDPILAIFVHRRHWATNCDPVLAIN